MLHPSPRISSDSAPLVRYALRQSRRVVGCNSLAWCYTPHVAPSDFKLLALAHALTSGCNRVAGPRAERNHALHHLKA